MEAALTPWTQDHRIRFPVVEAPSSATVTGLPTRWRVRGDAVDIGPQGA